MIAGRAKTILRKLLVSDDRHFVHHHVVTVLDVMDANSSVLPNPIGLDLFTLRVDVSDAGAELVPNGVA